MVLVPSCPNTSWCARSVTMFGDVAVHVHVQLENPPSSQKWSRYHVCPIMSYIAKKRKQTCCSYLSSCYEMTLNYYIILIHIIYFLCSSRSNWLHYILLHSILVKSTAVYSTIFQQIVTISAGNVIKHAIIFRSYACITCHVLLFLLFQYIIKNTVCQSHPNLWS